MKDKNGKLIGIGSKIKDEDGQYEVKLGSFDRKDNDETIAYGINNGTNKLLGPERAKNFEVIE